MDSYQNFVEIFKQAALNRDFDTLSNILENIQKSHIIVSTEHRESVVCSIFDRRNGLLCFLEYELNHRIKNRYLDNALTKGYIFLKFFMQQFYTTTCFVQYIHQIKDVCHLALTIKCSYYTQKYACNAFTTLIELFRNHDLKLDETMKKFIRAFNVNDIKERRLIFCVLGKIIKHDACASEKYSNIIFRQLYADAFKEYNPDTAIRNDFHMYFDILADILDSIEPSNKIKEKFFNLYKWIKDFNRVDRQQSIRVPMRSAIDLFSRHMNLFRDLLYPDYKYWHDVLRRLSHDTTTFGACGQRALKSFYRIIGQILTEQSSQESKSILSYFVEGFQKEFENSNLDLITLRLTIYGFSQMAAPCRTNMSEFIVEQIYSTITSYALPLCFNEQSDSAHIENVCYYQEALSEILCNMSDITIEKINVLVKLSIYTIKRFPDLVISKNATAISALIKTISNLGIINKNMLQRYLDNIIYDGIAWSCSHTLALDAELQRELNNLQQTPVCYKNYLPLWKELLKAQKYCTDDRERVAQHVADVLMNVCVTLIGRLDIRLKQTNEDTVLSDVALTQSAVNQADFRIFANLVDLYVDIIDASEPSLFFNTMHKFLYEIVRLSFKYPLISGFYKLVRAGMKSFVTRTSEEEEKSVELRRTEELLSNYLTHTLDLISAFSNELLIACLYLILEAPLTYIEDTLLRTLPAFKIAFTIGLSNLELAYTALTALETWTTTQKREQNERTNELLREIVMYLEPYLRSTESSVEISQDLTTTRKRVKRVDVIDTECTLRNFQRRVLLFFGSLSQDILSSFVHESASRSTGASWDYKNLLKYTLPLPDACPDIYFDRTLPRIIALACDSSDRRTKIAACETLHSMVTFVVGSTAHYLSDPENSFTPLYGILCSAVLTLGCDADEVVCGLFQPLALQLMHFLSSKFRLTSSVISQLLDSLFDGLTIDSNPSLRDFSGMCLAEFTRWSIRQSLDMQEIQPNVHEIVQRINNFALHPSTRKRVAAAIAFNHLYVILREEDDIVSIYWLEIFYCFVRSLDGCDDPSITNALAHVEKVMKFKTDLLNAHCNRRKPHEFDEATLNHALYWLLSQCGALDECCRTKCMELYVNISQHVNHSAQETTQIFVETYGMNRLNDIILRGLESCVEDISATGNIMTLLKALDYYVWLIEKELLPIEELFPANNAENHLIFSCIRSFAHQFWRVNMEPLAETATKATKCREFDKLQTLQCKALMTMLNFIQMLLNVDVNVLPESLWDESLSALTIKCVMHPRAIGFDIKNIEMMDRLPHVLETLLNSIKSKFGNSLPDTFKKCLSSSYQKHIEKLLHLNDIAQNDSCDKLIQHVNGLILLERCDMLDWTIWTGEMSAFVKSEETIMQIFNFLVSERIGELTCNDLSAQMIEYLRVLMKFQLSQISLTIETPKRLIPDDTRSMTERLIRLISDVNPVIGLDSTRITHGEHFLNTFRSVIFRYILTHVSVITLVFEEMSSDNPSFLLKWIEDLLLFLKQHKRELHIHVDPMVDMILKHFEHLENIAGNINSRKERLMNIYSIAVHLMSKPAEIMSMYHEFYRRILDKLIDSDDLEYKTQILRNFLVCLVDGTDRESDELRVILRNLRNDSRSLCPNLLTETGANVMKVINCFETLLMLLPTSIMMLNCVIHFAAGAGERLFDEKLREHLRIYYHGASNEHVLRSLEVTYREFMNMNKTNTERLDILRGFLLPTFEFCNATAIKRFFEQNIRELYMITNQRIPTYDHTADVQTIVSKIGCFQLITIMLTTIDVNNKDNAIVLDQTNPDSGLFKSLFNSAKNTRAVKIKQPECREFVRQLHCAAYNCSLAIVRLKKEEHFYSAAFGENRDFLIWENIVDCDKHYKLGQTFKDYPKTREITVNIRSTDDRYGQSTDRHAYIHTYDLSTSSLCEDINAYDLNRCVLLPSNHNSQLIVAANDSIDSNPLNLHSAASIVLESDDFNEHECMPYICVLLRHIIKSFKPSDRQPKWLQFFRNAMTYDHPNIKLFMLKIVSNTADEVFKPYAKFALMSIVKVITSYLKNYSLNYIITDVLEILIDWHDVAVLSDENERMEIQKLFEMLVDKVVTKRPDGDCRVYNYNLSLMRTLMEKWRDCLREPSISLDEKMVSAPNATVYLILALLDNNMAEKVVIRDDIVDFLLKPLRVWDAPETDEMSLQCCECFGLFLKFLNNANLDGEVERENNRDEEKKILAVLGSPISYRYMVKQVKRIAVLCRAYPAVAMDYINIVISAMAINLEKSYCLEIFILAMPKLGAENIVNTLRQMELQRVLTNRTSSCKMVLQIVRDMVATVSPTDLLSYVKLAVQYIKDNTTEHRELVYDILMNVYKRYSADIADDVTVQTLLSISVKNLLAGIMDPSHDLQEKILRFWTERTDFSTEKSKELLIALLNMHSLTAEGAFAPFVALLMLQLASKSMDWTKKIFDAPLQFDCTFEDYRIAVSWRRRNLSCVTPMFVDSLASQMSYSTFSENVDIDSRGNISASFYSRFSHVVPMRLRATQDLKFEPTLIDEDEAMMTNSTTTFGISSFDAEFNGTINASLSKRLPQSPMVKNKRFHRILARSSDVADIIRRKQIEKNVQRTELIKQENIRQRSKVRLYRDYRIGDFPDIEISYSSLIVPLQQLVKLDRLICKDVTVSLFCSLIKKIVEREKSNDFCDTVIEKLKWILHDSCEKDSSFNAIILETLLQLNVADCNPRDIVKVSKAKGLNALGILLLERSLLPDARDDDSLPTSSKRMRRQDDEETDKWAQLASLYKSQNDVDVVLSIFRKRRFFGEDVQEAALAEVNGDWIRAKDAFEKAYERTENPSMKEHCLQGLFEAVNNLCDWSAIDRLVKTRTNGDLNNIWNDAWRDWIMPYVCDSFVHMMAENCWESGNDDLLVIQRWMRDRDRLENLKSMVGEDLVTFMLQAPQRKATNLLNNLLDKIGEQWVGLSPLCIELRVRKLQKLQAINDLDASLKVLCTNEVDFLDKMVVLLNFWSTKAPTIRDNLIQWNKLAAYRIYSAMLFESSCWIQTTSNDELQEDGDEDNCEIRKRLRKSISQLRLDIGNAALNQKHRYIAEKHLNFMNGYKESIIYLHLDLPLTWLEARTKCLCADIESDELKKMSNYTASWEYSHQLLNKNEIDDNMSTAVREHISALASKIESFSRENDGFARALASNITILQDIKITDSTGVELDYVREQLLQYSLNNLRHVKATATNGEHYCALARYYYVRLKTTDVDSNEIFREFVWSILKSMSHDYLEATHYFPCLLRPEQLRNEKTRKTFVKECEKLQPWLFLRWRDLLFSHLGTSSITTAVVPIVEKLAETYPDAVVYTYYLAVERNPDILQDGRIQRIRSLLDNKAEEYKRFLQAIQYVVQPELYLKYYLDETMKELFRGKLTAIESLLRKVYPTSSTQAEKNPRSGKIYEAIARYKSEIRALDPNNLDATRERIQRIKNVLDRSLQKGTNNVRLKAYSPFLHEYTGGDIEVPGQYVGNKEPIPRYHVKIARFEPRVAVMHSLRKPIRIGMIGDNGREYKFLVKFGEDLTIDNGLQQLYATMNRTLSNDSSCRQRHLAIDTYEVIPLSRSFGLIQWIEDTKSLEDLVRFKKLKKESDRYESIRQRYAMWIAPSKRRIADQYKEAVFKYSQREVTEKMESFISETRRTALRDTFNAISPSPECFMTLRRNFVTSYATMCAAHWLAGVGDRHLQNTLVRVTTGRCLGIDFNHAFGSGIRAPIPELVPFRLTPQILELLRPFTEQDLLAMIMTHVIRALRDDQGPILACMDIFIHKPVNRSLSINDDEIMRDDGEDLDADLTWSSKKNIEIVAKKLNGIHPSFITLEQLKEAHENKYLTRYEFIITGNDESKQIRADITNDCLTPAEQVDCLLDQAKDLNILGRMYANWQPWL